MVTIQELDTELEELKGVEAQAQTLVSQSLPQRRYGSNIPLVNKQQQEVLKQRQQGRDALLQIEQRRKQLQDYRNELLEYERAKAEAEGERQAFEKAKQLIRSGRAYEARGRVKYYVDDLQAGGLTTPEATVQRAQRFREFELEQKKPELVLSEGAYQDFLDKGLIKEGRKVSVVSYKEIELPSQTIKEIEVEVEKPREYNAIEKGALFLRDKFPFLEKTAQRVQAKQSKADLEKEMIKDQGRKSPEFIRKLDEKYIQGLEFVSGKASKLFPKGTPAQKLTKQILFETKLPNPLTASETLKFAFFLPAMKTTTELKADLLSTKQIRPEIKTKFRADIRKVANKKYDINLVAKTEFGKDPLLKDTGIRSVQVSQQKAFDVSSKLVKGEGKGINILELSKRKFDTRIFTEKGLVVQVGKARYIKTTKLNLGKESLYFDRVIKPKSRAFASSSISRNTLRVDEVKVPSLQGMRTKLVYSKVKPDVSSDSVLGIFARKGKKTMRFLGTTQRPLLTKSKAIIPKEEIEIAGDVIFKKGKSPSRILTKPATSISAKTNIPEINRLALKQFYRTKSPTKLKLPNMVLGQTQRMVTSSRASAIASFDKQLSKQVSSVKSISAPKTATLGLSRASLSGGVKTNVRSFETLKVKPSSVTVERTRSVQRERLRERELVRERELLRLRQPSISPQRQLMKFRLTLPQVQRERMRIITPRITTPRIPMTTRFPMPRFNLRTRSPSKIKSKRSRSREGAFIVPSFTARALGLKQVIKERDILKEATKLRSGAEFRGIPVIKLNIRRR